MTKKFYLALLLSFSSFSPMAYSACPLSPDPDSPNFCVAFKSAAKCFCTYSLPAGMCDDMNQIAFRMNKVFGSLAKACQHQKYTPPQDCLDNWNCYLFGGVDSRNRICNGTRLPCTAN